MTPFPSLPRLGQLPTYQMIRSPTSRLPYTDSDYQFKNNADETIESGLISNTSAISYEYIMEYVDIDGYTHLQGGSRYAEFTVTNNMLTIAFFDSRQKNESYLTIMAEKS